MGFFSRGDDRIKGCDLVLAYSIGLLATAAVGLYGCATNNFVTVPMKYDSSWHIPMREAFRKSQLSPEDVVFLVSDNIRSRGGTIVHRDKTMTVPTLTAEAEADGCWAALHEIGEAEWHSFADNNFSEWKHIDRTAPFAHNQVPNTCNSIVMAYREHTDAWLLIGQLSNRSASVTVPVTTVVQNFQFAHGQGSVLGSNGNSALLNFSGQSNGVSIETNPAGQTVQGNFYTEYRVWVWPGKDGGSELYAVGVPAENGVRAAVGNKIGYDWWRQIDGRIEADIVQDMFYRLEEEERMLAVSQKAN